MAISPVIVLFLSVIAANLYCNATKPNVIIPGTLPESYFNRTFRNNDDNITYTVPEYCPGSLVFDDRNPRDCLCVPLSELRSTTPGTGRQSIILPPPFPLTPSVILRPFCARTSIHPMPKLA